MSGKKNFSESHVINPLLAKLVQSRWLDIGLVVFFFFCEFVDLDSVTVHKHAKERTWPISSHVDLTLGQQPLYIGFPLKISFLRKIAGSGEADFELEQQCSTKAGLRNTEEVASF